MPLCGASFAEPGIVFIDGHSTHVTRPFIDLEAKHGLHVVVEPSHTSMVLQLEDVGMKMFIKLNYSREYAAAMCSNGITGKIFDDTERIGCVVRSVLALQKEVELITSCFKKCGFLTGYNKVHKHFNPSMFAAGKSMRDTNLPTITSHYVRNVLSVSNISARQARL